MSATGTQGTSRLMQSAAAPGLKWPSSPVRERVPSGKTSSGTPSSSRLVAIPRLPAQTGAVDRERVEEQRGEAPAPPDVEEVVGGGAGREVAGQLARQRADDQRGVEVAESGWRPRRTGRCRPFSCSRPMTVTVASRQTSGLSIPRWATNRAVACTGEVKRSGSARASVTHRVASRSLVLTSRGSSGTRPVCAATLSGDPTTACGTRPARRRWRQMPQQRGQGLYRTDGIEITLPRSTSRRQSATSASASSQSEVGIDSTFGSRRAHGIRCAPSPGTGRSR